MNKKNPERIFIDSLKKVSEDILLSQMNFAQQLKKTHITGIHLKKINGNNYHNKRKNNNHILQRY